MKKKIILIILGFALLFITGCDVNYSAELKDDGTVSEKIILDFKSEDCNVGATGETTITCEQMITETLKYYVENEGYTNYYVDIKENGEDATATFTYEYPSLDEWKTSNTYKMAFESAEIEGNKFAYKNLQFPGDGISLNKVNILIKTNKVLKDNNANKSDISKGTYEWNFDVETGGNIEFTLTEKENIQKKYFEKTPVLPYIVIGAVVIIAVVILGAIISFKARNTNRL